ncbi:zinc finger protein 628-like isoform X2 [Macrosteles quadrilineatus]|uniref:zinc finger protein 628-like isoform X2 n=1 Tax=Macrosteles quadrilineatus TaxID=74068 RepID=UPI0023E20D2F|nr:zinc finger protein 628-like isoform X2 [Macrosteles quadrilineatus]
MGSEHYCLRWNNHQNNLLGVFSQLLQDESLVDVTLACAEGHSIRAHKVVLSACSSYFQSLFVDHPGRHPIVILKDVCFSELRTLVEFMYRGEVNVEYCRLSALLKTAESLKVKGLAEMTHLRGAGAAPPRQDDSEPPRAPEQPPASITPRPDTPPTTNPTTPPDAADHDARSRSPEAEDDLSSGPSDMTISRLPSPHTTEPQPGPSGLPPVQQVPLSLKKEVDWDRPEESDGRRSVTGESSSEYRHPHDPDEGEGRAIYSCMYCGAVFPHQSKLTRHILSHSLESLKYREQVTLGMQQSLASMGLMEGYRQTLDSTPLALDSAPVPMDADPSAALCKFCGKSFPDVGSLIGHLPVHTGDRPFKCEFCGKAFKLRHHMKDHCRVHTGERPFRCSLCGKTFSRSTILKAHEKTHYPKYVRKFLSSPSPEEERRPPDLSLPCDLTTSEPLYLQRPSTSP